MTAPVKLSRERWDLLGRAPLPDGTRAGHNSLDLSAPLEIDGIVFLPATYVPNDVAKPPLSEVMPSYAAKAAAYAQDHDPR